jgi:hypothetical protein
MHHDRSGVLVRIVIVAALLGVALWGYTNFSQQNHTTASLVPAQEETLADAGTTAMPEPATQPAPTTAAPVAPAVTPAPSARRSSTPAPAPAQNVPPPSTTIGTPPSG